MKNLFLLTKRKIIYIILMVLTILSTFLVLENMQKNKSSMVFEKEKLATFLLDSKIGYGDVVGKEFKCNPPSEKHYLRLDLSINDIYRVEFLDGNDLIDYMIINTYLNTVDDYCSLLYLVPEYVTEKAYTSIKIYPIDGDENYHVYFLDITQDTLLASEVDYFVDFEIEKIELEIDQENYEKIARDRQEAIELSIHLSDGVYMPASAYVNGEKFDTEIRLKGDWTDHMKGEKWSLRIKVEDDCIWGMSEFSIQNPDSRGGIGEYLIQEFYQYAGGVALRYSFVDVVINGTYMGVYAVEEGFTKRAVENSLKREGVIIKPNEDQLWEARVYYLETSLYSEEVANFEPYSMSKTLKDDKLYNYANYAINNLNSYLNGDMDFAEVYDPVMFGKYFAIQDLFKSMHGAIWHNMRYYYNPVTGLLEPVTFDEYVFSSTVYVYNYENMIKNTYNSDESLLKAYFESLYFYGQEMESFINDKQTEIDQLEYILSRDGYGAFAFQNLYSHVDTILDSIDEQGLDIIYQRDESEILMELNNKNLFPVTIIGLYINEELMDFSMEEDQISCFYEGEIDTIRVEYTLANIPDETFETIARDSWSFYVAGHAYGAHIDGNDGIHTPFLEYLDEIESNKCIEFGVLTGDTVFEASQESFDQLKEEMAITDKPYYIAAGNHCLAGGLELFQSNFGELNYYFEKDQNLFLLLVPGENWSFSQEQMDMVESAFEEQDYDNVFVFMHYLAWAEEDNIFSTCGTPNSWTTGKSDESNFWTDFIKGFAGLDSQVYFIAGDVGAFTNPNLIYENIENYHFIASGMGNRIMDNILIVNIDQNNEVTFDIKVFENDIVIDGGNMEDYKTLEVNSIDEIN